MKDDSASNAAVAITPSVLFLLDRIPLTAFRLIA
jgi:hypothetical protein